MLADAVDGECAQLVFLFVPSVEIPAFTISSDALGRDGSFGRLVAGARAVLNPELLALESSANYILEGWPSSPRGQCRQADACGDLAEIQVLSRRELFDAFCE